MKKIAYISGTRADFGLMSSVLHQIETAGFSLQIYATGMHLMSQFGSSVAYVQKEFPSTIPIPAIFPDDTRQSQVIFSSQLLNKVTSLFSSQRPDLVFTVGDRIEMITVSLACLYLGIPTAHFHGGDLSGTVDEISRHTISKLSSLHFPATKDSAKRIRLLGEEHWRIHVVGAPALDYIRMQTLPSQQEIQSALQLPLAPFILVAQHPVSEEIEQSGRQMRATLSAIKKTSMPAVIVYPNADAGNAAMIKEIEQVGTMSNIRIIRSVPYPMFLSLLKYCAVLVGNSSSGIIEAASFKSPVIDIGVRQRGRQHGKNVLHVPHNSHQIYQTIMYALHAVPFKKQLSRLTNPWGDGHAGEKVIDLLRNIPDTKRLLEKKFP